MMRGECLVFVFGMESIWWGCVSVISSYVLSMRRIRMLIVSSIYF